MTMLLLGAGGGVGGGGGDGVLLFGTAQCPRLICEGPMSLVASLEMKHKGSMDTPLVGGEGLFDNDCFLGEVVTWMEDASCVQFHLH